ncbi:MAG: DUF485 domain-containing protein [Verrucomicrobiales bacterium]|nr:DUF485 domain-containing protein [Verrucomicrobiales bacterium]
MSSPSSHPSPEAEHASWQEIEKRPQFAELLRAKARFVIPATVFFVVYYFALLILVGWYPEVMKKEAFWGMNWAYAFALSQFPMAWILAAIYMKVAAGWDKMAADVIKK